MSRDFSTISPSARWLLLAKAHSGLPYARQAAELMFGAQAVAEAAVPPSPFEGIRRKHFELRARSIDDALDAGGETRVLELAAGFSLRGLVRAASADVHYVDTDLPGVVEMKQALVAQLAGKPAGTYRIEPLDVLDRESFTRIVESIPTGPLAIAQEGLLMYLDPAEKARVAETIRTTIQARGGAWICADIYVRTAVRPLPQDESMKQYLEQHRVEENKFADWAEAETFFANEGFDIASRLLPPTNMPSVRQTWVLRPR